MLVCVSAEPLDQIIALKTNKAVYDQANLLAANETAYLEQTLDAYNAQTGNAIVIVTVNDMNGDYIEHYSVNLAETWGIGKAKEDNGLLILAAMQERKLRIEVGYGLEDKITDAFASQVIADSLTPNFKNKQYFTAFNESVNSIINKINDNETQLKDVFIKLKIDMSFDDFKKMTSNNDYNDFYYFKTPKENYKELFYKLVDIVGYSIRSNKDYIESILKPNTIYHLEYDNMSDYPSLSIVEIEDEIKEAEKTVHELFLIREKFNGV